MAHPATARPSPAVSPPGSVPGCRGRAGVGIALVWLVPGVVLCLVVAVLDAWVLLIEILR
jgi:hypothetical protein